MVDDLPPEAAPEPTPAPEKPVDAPASPPAEDWETRFKYLLADFENYRKRSARDEGRLSERARAELLRRLLPLFDAVEQARMSVRKLPPNDPVRRGLDLLFSEWSVFLEGEGVRVLARAGSRFRADEQEAVAEAPATSTHPAGTIVEVVQQGYATLAGVLRPAKVVVARTPTDKRPPETEAVAVEPPDARTEGA